MKQEPFITAVKEIFKDPEDLPLYSWKLNPNGERVFISHEQIMNRFGPMSWPERIVLIGLIKKRVNRLYGHRKIK